MRPGGVVLVACHVVNVQLGHLVAQRRDVDLFRVQAFLELPRQVRGFPDQPLLVVPDTLAMTDALWVWTFLFCYRS